MMRLIATEIQTEHVALILSAMSMLGMLILGILQIQSRRQGTANSAAIAAAQTPECRYQHEGLQVTIDRVEIHQEKILETQRIITQALDRVATTLDRVADKIDGEHGR